MPRPLEPDLDNASVGMFEKTNYGNGDPGGSPFRFVRSAEGWYLT